VSASSRGEAMPLVERDGRKAIKFREQTVGNRGGEEMLEGKTYPSLGQQKGRGPSDEAPKDTSSITELGTRSKLGGKGGASGGGG